MTQYDGGMTLVYRMVALDIDGTLLQRNNKLNRRTKDTISFVKNKSVYVTVVTERHFHSAQKVAKALKLNVPIITQNGAFVAQSIDDPLYENRLRPETAKPLIDLLEKNYDCHMRVSHERFSIGNRVNQKNELIAKMTIGISDPLFYPVTFVDSLADYLLDNAVSPTKIAIHFFKKEEKEAAMQSIDRHFPEVHVTSGQNHECEVVSHGVSKARGVQVLAESLGVDDSEIVAVGDDSNDKAMIARAGLGIAMKNAPASLRQSADWVTRSNDQNGVAYALREVFRKQLRMQI